MRRLSSSECRLLALSVMRRTAIYLDAIGGIADIGRHWREMVMTLMTRSGHHLLGSLTNVRIAQSLPEFCFEFYEFNLGEPYGKRLSA